MYGMFSFLGMADNYEERKVARDEFPWGFVSTCYVTDGAHDYETAVEHSEYRDDGMVVVEAYDTREEALAGHARWVEMMTSANPPESLVDCANADVARMFSDEIQVFVRKSLP